MLGVTHLLSVVFDELWNRLHAEEQGSPKHQISRPGYSSQSLVLLVIRNFEV